MGTHAETVRQTIEAAYAQIERLTYPIHLYDYRSSLIPGASVTMCGASVTERAMSHHEIKRNIITCHPCLTAYVGRFDTASVTI